MKCLIYCHERGSKWVSQYFSDAEPYMLRIGNKPLLEFFIEFCILNGIKDIYIIKKRISYEIEKYFEDGSKWDARLHYSTLDVEDKLKEVLRSNKELFYNDELLVFNGFFFLQYKKSHLSNNFLPHGVSWQNLSSLGHGLLFLNDPASYKQGEKLEHFEGKHFLQAKNFNSIKTYYNLNMEMVSGAARDYTMPSYNNERGVFIGQNVEIMYDCEITKPIILGDNIQLKKHSRIGPGAIIGSNSLIDSQTTICHSVIYRNSYIGTKLELDGKIIYKRRMIDPETGATIDIIDDFLLAEVNSEMVLSFTTWIMEVILVSFLFCFQLIFYLVLRPWVKGNYEEMTVWRDKSGLRKIRLKIFVCEKESSVNKLFIKLSLNKFHLLPMCMVRRIRLIGCALRPATKESLKNIRELSDYYPAIFSFSDMCGDNHDAEKFQVDELFYIKHATLRFNAAILFKSLIFNFFGWVNVKRD